MRLRATLTSSAARRHSGCGQSWAALSEIEAGAVRAQRTPHAPPAQPIGAPPMYPPASPANASAPTYPVALLSLFDG
eukprot:4607458-Alexandrium_andersonii.AAC.1